MATAAAFDTHRFIQNLIKSGFTVQQAETLAYEQVDLLNSNLATTQDLDAKLAGIRRAHESGLEEIRRVHEAKLEEIRRSHQSKLAEIRRPHNAKPQSAKWFVIKWIYPAFVVQSILIVALYKLL